MLDPLILVIPGVEFELNYSVSLQKMEINTWSLDAQHKSCDFC